MEDNPSEKAEDLMNVEEDTEKPKATSEEDLETDDNSQEEETNQFLSLMTKAEKKNQRRLARKGKISNNKSSWRDVNLSHNDESSTDTEDEDDPTETRKFLSMMKAGSSKPKNLVNIRWVSGKVAITPVGEGEGDLTITRLPPGETHSRSEGPARQNFPDGVTITRVAATQSDQETAARRQQVELERRRREVRQMRAEQDSGGSGGSQQGGGKRKFEDRMTLTEAKVGDFQDSRDYVDFLQSKLQGINIKIVK